MEMFLFSVVLLGAVIALMVFAWWVVDNLFIHKGDKKRKELYPKCKTTRGGREVNKRMAVLITVGAVALIYLFLLVGLPALEDTVSVGGSCNSSETADNNAVFDVATINWTPVGPALDVRPSFGVEPFKVKYKTPLIIYLIPGLVGVAAIVVILKQKKEAK